MPSHPSRFSEKTDVLPRRIALRSAQRLSSLLMASPVASHIAPLVSAAQLAQLLHLRVTHRGAAEILVFVEEGSAADLRRLLAAYGIPLREL